jgi:hypothetical protein
MSWLLDHLPTSRRERYIMVCGPIGLLAMLAPLSGHAPLLGLITLICAPAVCFFLAWSIAWAVYRAPALLSATICDRLVHVAVRRAHARDLAIRREDYGDTALLGALSSPDGATQQGALSLAAGGTLTAAEHAARVDAPGSSALGPTPHTSVARDPRAEEARRARIERRVSLAINLSAALLLSPALLLAASFFLDVQRVPALVLAASAALARSGAQLKLVAGLALIWASVACVLSLWRAMVAALRSVAR